LFVDFAFFKNPPTHEQTVSFLEERLAVIREKLKELRVIEAFIEAKLIRYRDSAKAAASKENSTISCSTRPVAKPRNGLGRK
jgi:hypothetical protein